MLNVGWFVLAMEMQESNVVPDLPATEGESQG